MHTRMNRIRRGYHELGVHVSEEIAVLLGVIQGITEWIPLSSQGVVALVASQISGVSTSDAIAIALWLHVGTALSAAIAMRHEITSLAQESIVARYKLSTPARFLILSTIVTAAIGIPVYVLLGEAADFGGAVMLLIGLAMLGTALAIRRRHWQGEKGRNDMRGADAAIVGVAQALAVIPGLSRTGLTVAALLARGCSQREAVVLSVLMGIPASVGAGILALMTSELLFGWAALLGMTAAAVVGTIVIRAILAWASRVRLAPFVAVVGLAIFWVDCSDSSPSCYRAIGRAGAPTTVVPSATFVVTTDPQRCMRLHQSEWARRALTRCRRTAPSPTVVRCLS